MVCILSFSEISPKSNSASSPCKKLFIKLVICQGTRCYLAKFTICFEQSCLCDWVQCPLSAASARPRPTAACGRADSEAVPWAGSPAAVCWGAAPEGAVCWEDAARAEEGGAGRWCCKGIVIGSAWKMSQREDSGRAGVGRVLAGVASPFSQLYWRFGSAVSFTALCSPALSAPSPTLLTLHPPCWHQAPSPAASPAVPEAQGVPVPSLRSEQHTALRQLQGSSRMAVGAAEHRTDHHLRTSGGNVPRVIWTWPTRSCPCLCGTQPLSTLGVGPAWPHQLGHFVRVCWKQRRPL